VQTLHPSVQTLHFPQQISKIIGEASTGALSHLGGLLD
jgi:hypothetical protein